MSDVIINEYGDDEWPTEQEQAELAPPPVDEVANLEQLLAEAVTPARKTMLAKRIREAERRRT